MNVIFSNEQQNHAPDFFLVRGRLSTSAERPERAEILLAAAKASGLEPLEASRFPRDCLLRVHTPDYLHFLEDGSRQWQALGDVGPEVVANVHPSRVPATYPRSIVGRAGWHMADAACPLGPDTFRAACRSADAALTGADLVLAGEPSAYALCRPPGHHAYADMAGGFCFLNNSAIAATHLAASGARVAILDIDVHHGNGTQQIFYDSANIVTASIHADPADYYPFYWGHAHERGSGAGLGYNLNLPLPLGSGDELWLRSIDEALAWLDGTAPAFLVVALGLDAHESDPLRGMRVTTRAFAGAGRKIAGFGRNTLLVQEGGYLSSELGTNLSSFLGGYLGLA